MTYLHKTIILVLTSWLFFLNPPVVFAAYQTCKQGETCSVGEFLFDDSYTPITTATCTLTSRNPDGTTHLNEAAMTTAAENDGWYSYSFTTNDLDLGTYRAKICCLSGSDNLCLDKTFIIAPADLTASDVWEHQDRSLTSFGSLVSDIWSNSNRSLTSFGDLITNLWGNTTRTLTDTGNLATKTDIQNLGTTTITNTNLIAINNELAEQRELLEAVANKPVIETSIEENFVSLESKLEETESKASSLAKDTEILAVKSQDLLNNWLSLSASQIIQKSDDLLSLIGNEDDQDQSLVTNSNWLAIAWDIQVTKDLQSQILNLKDLTTDLRSQADFYGKAETKPIIQELADSTTSLKNLIGKSSDLSNRLTLYGYLSHLKDLNRTLTDQEKRLNDLTTTWNKTKPDQLDGTLSQIRNQLLGLKLIPQPQVLGASTNDDPAVTQRNELFNLKALIQTSRNILSQFAGKPIQHIWLEEGSIIFKAIVSNPSTVIRQSVPLKFYLPAEITKDSIIQIDPELVLNFDPDRNTYFVSGQFDLEPGATRTFKIEVSDIWQIDKELIESYRGQAEQLLEPLKNTSYYGQGATVKADIDVTLDKIVVNFDNLQTPEERIRTYREAQIELTGIEQKLLVLQDLVSSAGATGSIFGFVGGVQAVAVWGLIIIVITGFVYLSLYMRALNLQLSSQRGHVNKNVSSPTLLELLGQLTKRSSNRGHRLAQFIFFILLSASISVFISAFYVRLAGTTPTIADREQNTPKPATSITPAIKQIAKNPTKQAVLGTTEDITVTYFIIKVAPGKPTSIYTSQSISSPVLLAIRQSQVVSRLKEEGEWSMIELLVNEELKTGWIESKYLVSEPTN